MCSGKNGDAPRSCEGYGVELGKMVDVDVDPTKPIPTPELTNGPILMRPWLATDVDSFLTAQQDPDIRVWAGGVETRDDAAALLRRLTTKTNRVAWAVVDKQGG